MLTEKQVVSLAVVCIAIGLVAMVAGWCASNPAPRVQAPAPSPAGAIPGVTVHPQGVLAPMPLDAVSPPYLVDYGDGKGPKVERGVLRFGDAQTSG